MLNLAEIFIVLAIFSTVGCNLKLPSSPSSTVVASQTVQTTSECSSNADVNGYDIHWCHEYAPTRASTDVIYFFHGLDGSEHSWENSDLQKALRSPQVKTSPHVISVSFGKRWFLSDVGFVHESRLKTFTDKVMPMIEATLGFTPSRRMMMGESMGGYNAIRAAEAMSSEVERVVALCPAIMPYSPYWPAKERHDFYDEHPYVDSALLTRLTLFAIWEFPGPSAFARNNPMIEAQSAWYKIPQLLITSNAHDQFGFNVGIAKYVTELRATGQAVEYLTAGGSHCQRDADVDRAITDFLK